MWGTRRTQFEMPSPTFLSYTYKLPYSGASRTGWAALCVDVTRGIQSWKGIHWREPPEGFRREWRENAIHFHRSSLSTYFTPPPTPIRPSGYALWSTVLTPPSINPPYNNAVFRQLYKWQTKVWNSHPSYYSGRNSYTEDKKPGDQVISQTRTYDWSYAPWHGVLSSLVMNVSQKPAAASSETLVPTQEHWTSHLSITDLHLQAPCVLFIISTVEYPNTKRHILHICLLDAHQYTR